jgi:predicted transcriptional regulator
MKKSKADPEQILNKLFGSVTRARILCLLHTFPGQSFYQREIMFETGLSLRPVQRELANLVDLGIITKQEKQNRVFYHVNSNSPFFKSLGEIFGAGSHRKDE